MKFHIILNLYYCSKPLFQMFITSLINISFLFSLYHSVFLPQSRFVSITFCIFHIYPLSKTTLSFFTKYVYIILTISLSVNHLFPVPLSNHCRLLISLIMLTSIYNTNMYILHICVHVSMCVCMYTCLYVCVPMYVCRVVSIWLTNLL